MKIPNLLLIAGTGTKAGKTTMACRIIEEFGNLRITAIKISPHFHETTAGLILKTENKGFAIYEESGRDTKKDTSRMLLSGADKVYFAKVWDDQLHYVFTRIMEYIPPGEPVICESPALRYFLEPGVFIIMESSIVNKHKDIRQLQSLPHVMFKLEELESINNLPFRFEDGKWVYKREHIA
jgi:hypothetical protein